MYQTSENSVLSCGASKGNILLKPKNGQMVQESVAPGTSESGAKNRRIEGPAHPIPSLIPTNTRGVSFF